MKIVIAAWHLQDFNVGLGRYCRGLIEAIGRVDKENRYEILMPDDSYRFSQWPNVRYRLIRFPIFERRFWEQVVPLVGGRYDLLHFPYDPGVAWKRGKFVVTVHDIKPLIFACAGIFANGACARQRSFPGNAQHGRRLRCTSGS